MDKLPEELTAALPPVIQKLLTTGLPLDDVAQAIADRLYDEEDEIAESLMALETEILLAPESQRDSLREERDELTKTRDLLRRILDHLDAVPCFVERTDATALAFRGRLVGEVSSRRGKVTRWTELRLYRTEDGRYIAEEVGETTNPGEVARRRVAVLANDEKVVGFFGFGSLSRPLYDQAGIVAVEAL